MYLRTESVDGKEYGVVACAKWVFNGYVLSIAAKTIFYKIHLWIIHVRVYEAPKYKCFTMTTILRPQYYHAQCGVCAVLNTKLNQLNNLNYFELYNMHISGLWRNIIVRHLNSPCPFSRHCRMSKWFATIRQQFDWHLWQLSQTRPWACLQPHANTMVYALLICFDVP